MSTADLPLENYVERRDRCQAYRYRHPDQTAELAAILRARSYTFEYTDDGWKLTVVQGVLGGSSDETREILVNRGDFIVLKNIERLEYEIVPPRSFRESYEEERP